MQVPEFQFTNQEIQEWVKRHDLQFGSETDARAAFEDAASMYLLKEPVQPQPKSFSED